MTPGFAMSVTRNSQNFATDGGTFGSISGGPDGSIFLGKYFLLRNLAISADVQYGTGGPTSGSFNGSGTLNFDGFPPYQRYSLPGFPSSTSGIFGNFSDPNSSICQFSMVYAYYGPQAYILLPSLQFAGTLGNVTVTRSDLSGDGFVSGFTTPIFGVNTPVWYEPSHGAPVSFSLTVNDGITNAYYTSADFTPMPAFVS